MPAQVKQDECTGCGDCKSACPVDGSITLQDGKAEVQPEECIECSACVDACTSGAISLT